MENMRKLNKIIFYNKNIDIQKLPNPIRETRVSKPVFITIPCLKFWALKNNNLWPMATLYMYLYVFISPLITDIYKLCKL